MTQEVSMPGSESIKLNWDDHHLQELRAFVRQKTRFDKKKKTWQGRRRPRTNYDIEVEDRRTMNTLYWSLYRQNPRATRQLFNNPHTGRHTRWQIDTPPPSESFDLLAAMDAIEYEEAV
jgi:hypothetical protein